MLHGYKHIHRWHTHTRIAHRHTGTHTETDTEREHAVEKRLQSLSRGYFTRSYTWMRSP